MLPLHLTYLTQLSGDGNDKCSLLDISLESNALLSKDIVIRWLVLNSNILSDSGRISIVTCWS
jgi:hypothetical protein